MTTKVAENFPSNRSLASAAAPSVTLSDGGTSAMTTRRLVSTVVLCLLGINYLACGLSMLFTESSKGPNWMPGVVLTIVVGLAFIAAAIFFGLRLPKSQ
jgi:hypothetical protein